MKYNELELAVNTIIEFGNIGAMELPNGTVLLFRDPKTGQITSTVFIPKHYQNK